MLLQASVAAAVRRGPPPGGAVVPRVYHHALKPTNIFVDAGAGYAVRLSDFAASVVRRASPTHEAYVHSAPWWAPEQLQPSAVLGAPADVFAAALVAFYALTGRSYWMSCQTSPPDLARWQAEVMGPRTPASQRAQGLGGSIQASIDETFARALSVSQAERPASVSVLAQALATASGSPAAAPQVAKTVAFDMVLPDAAFTPPPAFGGNAGPPAGTPPGGAPLAGPEPTGAQPSLPAAGTSSGESASPGLPPFPPAKKKKTNPSLLPIAIGAGVALLLGGLGLGYLLLNSGEEETGPAEVGFGGNEPHATGDDASASGAPVAGGSGGAGEGAAAAAGADDGKGGSDAAPVKVRVRIVCIPECDEVLIDAEKVDGSAVQELLPGKHTVKVTKQGYLPKTDTLDLAIGSDKDAERKIEYRLLKPGVRPTPTPKPCGQFLQPCK